MTGLKLCIGFIESPGKPDEQVPILDEREARSSSQVMQSTLRIIRHGSAITLFRDNVYGVCAI